jgi:hypothetical protein
LFNHSIFLSWHQGNTDNLFEAIWLTYNITPANIHGLNLQVLYKWLASASLVVETLEQLNLRRGWARSSGKQILGRAAAASKGGGL